MCGEGVCAHGSRTAPATDVAVPHDSAVPTNAECTRMCTIDLSRHVRVSAESARGGVARLIRPQPREPPHRGPPHPRHYKHAPCLRCNDTPQPRTGSTTDLDTECDRSRAGSGPISTRVTTDLAPEPDRSRRDLARGAECGRTPASRLTRLTFSNEIDGGTVDLVRKSQSRRRSAGG